MSSCGRCLPIKSHVRRLARRTVFGRHVYRVTVIFSSPAAGTSSGEAPRRNESARGCGVRRSPRSPFQWTSSTIPGPQVLTAASGNLVKIVCAPARCGACLRINYQTHADQTPLSRRRPCLLAVFPRAYPTPKINSRQIMSVIADPSPHRD